MEIPTSQPPTEHNWEERLFEKVISKLLKERLGAHVEKLKSF